MKCGVEREVEKELEPEAATGFGTILNALLDRAKSNDWSPVCFKLPEIIIMLCDLTITHESVYVPQNSQTRIPLDISSSDKISLICDEGVLEFKISISTGE